MLSGKRIRELPLHVMILPGILLMFIFNYFPMMGLVMAFEKFIPIRGLIDSQWVGFENFRYMMNLPDTMQVLKNTVYIYSMKTAAEIISPIVIAVLLNELSHALIKRGIQTMLYLPHFLSWVILGGILVDILSPSHGIVNQIITAFGAKPVYFLGNDNWFPFVIVISDIWKEVGYGTIIFLAALTGINPALYEAAMIDGASRWRQTLHITLPGITPIIIVVATFTIANVLNGSFDQIFNLYSPMVYESGDVIDTLVYRMGLINSQFGPATAIGMLKSVVTLLFVSVFYWLAYRLANYRIF